MDNKVHTLQDDKKLSCLKGLKRGLLPLFRFYLALILIAVIYKIIFLAFNHGGESCNLGDYASVAIHGIKHDLAVAGYFTVIPLVLTLATVFINMPLRIFFMLYNILIAFATALAFISDFTLYSYWGHKLDASAILVYIDSPSNAVASVTVMHLIILAVTLAALTFIIYKILAYACRSRGMQSKSGRSSIFGRVAQCAAYIFMGGIMFLGIRGGVTESTNNIGTVYYTNRTTLNHAAVNPVFSFLYTLANMENFSEEYKFYNEKDLKEITDGLYMQNTQLTDTLLNTTRPNVITIVLEGMSAAFVGELEGLEDVTPNINRLSHEGILFTDCHANSYRTDRGLICTLSGYPSFPKTSIMKDANKCQKLPSLAASLKSAGYTNTFLYGGDINFTNMKGYLYSTGYGNIISDKDFTAEERLTHRWGVGDDITFNRLYEIIKEQRAPWHITYLTLSSHEPWQVPYNRIPNDEIANSFAFTDEMLGHFIDRLKETELWKNTLIICIADHTVAGYPEGSRQTDRNRNRILCMLLGGAVKEPRVIKRICNQTDIVATILAQLGLPIEEFTFSRNIFSPQYIYPFAYNCFNNGITFIDSTGHSTLDLDSKKELLSEPANGGKERLERAKAILQGTYGEYTGL